MNMKKVYKAIAKRNGVSVVEVEREIKAAIDEVYKNPNKYAQSIPCAGDKPTPEEFIEHIVRELRASDNSGR